MHGPQEIAAQFGHIDIYLFDQLQRGRLTLDMRVLDAGCGPGRNAHYLMRAGADVHGIDSDPQQVEQIRALARAVAPALPEANFQVADVTNLPFADASFDFVISSAVLHFADHERHFETMLGEMWRVVSAGGVLFARLASSIGIEDRVVRSEGRRFTLPDGTDRFLVDEAYLLRLTAELGGRLLDPLKTTNVQGMRAMTTWVIGKGSG
ncbi:MAG: class I SAM-dependent methyltransferase [Gemmatimonadetes bacterium]|jgi:tellurite methyltransferase|nr:class I SAM-dependent methyltransferase [Gemmatimonadota bacterium]